MANEIVKEYVVASKMATLWKTDPETGKVLQGITDDDRLGRVSIGYGQSVFLTEKRAAEIGFDVVKLKADFIAEQSGTVAAVIAEKETEIASLREQLAQLRGEQPEGARKPGRPPKE